MQDLHYQIIWKNYYSMKFEEKTLNSQTVYDGKIIKVLGIVVVFLLSLFSIYHIIQSRALDENAAD